MARPSTIFPAASVAALLALILTSCVGDRAAGGEPARRSRQVSTRSGPRPPPQPAPADIRQCFADLDRAAIAYRRLPDAADGPCIRVHTIQLLDIGMPTTNLTAMTCPLARNFAGWARYAINPAAWQILGSRIARVETMGTYSCRNRNGIAGARLSEHALANAVDVSAFVLEDGRRISVRDHWNGTDEPARRFLRVLHASACRRFRTVLSPDYNAAHVDHLHFDMGGRPFCR